MASGRFSQPVELARDELFTRGTKFAIDRQHAAVMPVLTGLGSHVQTVTDDDDQLDDALRAAGAGLLGQQYGYAHAGFARHALRPTGQGDGRDRWR
ncbi:MAG: hypothetical protein ACRDNZ_14250 [Streptosporangiaceae bacterium]